MFSINQNIFLSSLAVFVLILVVSPQGVTASSTRSGPYDNERGAWGGNGGWWGDSRRDWYGEYGTPEERAHPAPHTYYHTHTAPYSYGSHPNYPLEGYHPNEYYYDNQYPYSGAYEGESIDGAAIYFNVK